MRRKRHTHPSFTVFLLLSLVTLYSSPVAIAASTVEQEYVIYSSSDDGYIRRHTEDYNNTWSEIEGNTLDDTFDEIYVGQSYATFDYTTYRGFLFFDTTLPSGTNITSAVLGIYAKSLDGANYKIVIQHGETGYPQIPLQLNDYYKARYSGNGGEISVGDMGIDYYNNITLNSEGIGWINTEGTSSFCLRIDQDILGITPTLYNITTFSSGDSLSSKPILTLQTTSPAYLLWSDFIAGIFSQFWSYVALASLLPLCTVGVIVLMAREGHFNIKLIGMMIGLSIGLVIVVIILGITNNAVQI